MKTKTKQNKTNKIPTRVVFQDSKKAVIKHIKLYKVSLRLNDLSVFFNFRHSTFRYYMRSIVLKQSPRVVTLGIGLTVA